MHYSFINLFIFHSINHLYFFAFQFNCILSLTRQSTVGNSFFLSNNNLLSHLYVNRRLKETDQSPQNKQSIELSVNSLNLPIILSNREHTNSKLYQRNIFKRIFNFFFFTIYIYFLWFLSILKFFKKEIIFFISGGYGELCQRRQIQRKNHALMYHKAHRHFCFILEKCEKQTNNRLQEINKSKKYTLNIILFPF